MQGYKKRSPILVRIVESRGGICYCKNTFKTKSSALVRCSTGSVVDSSAAKLRFKFEFSKYFSRNLPHPLTNNLLNEKRGLHPCNPRLTLVKDD